VTAGLKWPPETWAPTQTQTASTVATQTAVSADETGAQQSTAKTRKNAPRSSAR
jgi:hypothetical protein